MCCFLSPVLADDKCFSSSSYSPVDETLSLLKIIDECNAEDSNPHALISLKRHRNYYSIPMIAGCNLKHQRYYDSWLCAVQMSEEEGHCHSVHRPVGNRYEDVVQSARGNIRSCLAASVPLRHPVSAIGDGFGRNGPAVCERPVEVAAESDYPFRFPLQKASSPIPRVVTAGA